MSAGKDFVNSLNQIFALSHSRLHAEHRSCIICGAGPFKVVEDIIDHLDGHPERLRLLGVVKDDSFIVLCEPSDYYWSHGQEIPDSITRLVPIEEQSSMLGVDPEQGDHMLEYLDFPRKKPN